MEKTIFLFSSILVFLLSCSDNPNDPTDPDGARLEVSISSDRFVTEEFTCVTNVDHLVIGAHGTSDGGEDVSIAGQFGQDAGRQQLVMSFHSEIWEVTLSDDPSEVVGTFIELTVDIDNRTVSGNAAVEEVYSTQSDGTDTMIFDIQC